MRKTRDAVEILDRRYGGTPEWDRMVIEEEINARVAQLVYALRTEAGLTQTGLAERIGTKQPVISKLENADYEGSALELLWRICTVLDKKLEVSCRDRRSRRKCPVRIEG